MDEYGNCNICGRDFHGLANNFLGGCEMTALDIYVEQLMGRVIYTGKTDKGDMPYVLKLGEAKLFDPGTLGDLRRSEVARAEIARLDRISAIRGKKC